VASIERTAYPRFKRVVSARELEASFTPTLDEIAWAQSLTKSPAHLLGLVLALKCFQRLGRFPPNDEVPDSVTEHVRTTLGLAEEVNGTATPARTVRQHRSLVREHLGVIRIPGTPARSRRRRSTQRPKPRTTRPTSSTWHWRSLYGGAAKSPATAPLTTWQRGSARRSMGPLRWDRTANDQGRGPRAGGPAGGGPQDPAQPGRRSQATGRSGEGIEVQRGSGPPRLGRLPWAHR